MNLLKPFFNNLSCLQELEKIVRLSEKVRIRELKEKEALTDITFPNIIIGGPPCQGFSMAGKRDKKDPRNSLFMEYIRFVKYIKPDAFVMENVPGILTMKTNDGELVVNIIQNEFSGNSIFFLYTFTNKCCFI